MKPMVLITKKVFYHDAVELLEKDFDVDFFEEDFTLQNLQNYFKTKNPFAFLTFVSNKVSKDIIETLPKSVKVISNFGVGYNNIDIEYASEKNIAVTNIPDAVTDSTADFTFALLLSLSRRVIEAHNFVLNNKFKTWGPDLFLGTGLSGKTLGIIGLGRIGHAVATRAKAFNMNVIYYNRNPRSEKLDFEENIYYREMNDLLQESDFISIHTSLNKTSLHLISKKEFDLMKKAPFIINTSRGECIKEEDLVNALKEEKISGAGLDVFEFEPKVTEELKSFSNVILTPHIGSGTHETRRKMLEIACTNIRNIFYGKEPVSRVV